MQHIARKSNRPIRKPHLGVIRRIWPPGLSLVLASSGFGTIAAFLALRYGEMGWSGAALGLTSELQATLHPSGIRRIDYAGADARRANGFR